MRYLSSVFTVLALLMLFTSFAIRPVSAQEAPIADGDGPYSIDEGASVVFDGSSSFDPDGTIESYEWDLNRDTVPDATGPNPTLSWAELMALGINNQGVYNVMLRVTDNDGETGLYVAMLVIFNVAPTADAGPDQTVFEGETVYFSGSFTDPGSCDTHSIVWDFGDGSYAYDTLTPTHIYTSAGIYEVILAVRDEAWDSSTDTLTVTVNPTAGVPEFPIGFALEIVLVPLFLYIWWKRKHITLP